ncbi:MAG: hypothetical protein MHM6MM_004249 [Cercozoa sp. M6MM]
MSGDCGWLWARGAASTSWKHPLSRTPMTLGNPSAPGTNNVDVAVATCGSIQRVHLRLRVLLSQGQAGEQNCGAVMTLFVRGNSGVFINGDDASCHYARGARVPLQHGDSVRIPCSTCVHRFVYFAPSSWAKRSRVQQELGVSLSLPLPSLPFDLLARAMLSLGVARCAEVRQRFCTEHSAGDVALGEHALCLALLPFAEEDDADFMKNLVAAQSEQRENRGLPTVIVLTVLTCPPYSYLYSLTSFRRADGAGSAVGRRTQCKQVGNRAAQRRRLSPVAAALRAARSVRTSRRSRALAAKTSACQSTRKQPAHTKLEMA